MKKITIYASTEVTTQKEAVLWHLGRYNTLTAWEAIKEYGITRLSHYILVLRQEGYDIVSVPVQRVTRFGRSTTIVNYHYVQPHGQLNLEL